MPDPIRIGIVHSLRGPMALSESAMVDAALLAVEEINAHGGLLGRPLQAIIADGESDPSVFQNQARKLIRSDKAQALFGCWTSSARKAVKTVVEGEDSLLWYPVQYEGLEQSPNIVYTGSCLNQQIQPFIEWCLAQEWKRFFLVGSEYVFPHTANKLIYSLLHGVEAQVVGEKYFPLDCDDFAILSPLLHEAKPDIVINTVNGYSNDKLFAQVFCAPRIAQGLQAFSTSCTEIDFARIGEAAQGHLSCWSYFQSLQGRENEAFIAKYRARFGDDRLVSDPLVTAYAQVHLWAGIVTATGTFSPAELKDQLAGQPIHSPLGRMEVCPNRHVARKALIGRYRGDGQHEILWQSRGYIDPLPWMGMEDVDIPSRALILDLLKEIPDEIAARIRLKNEIDERRRAEKELRKKSQELELYFSSSLDLLCIANTDGRFIRLNPEWEKVLGYSISELEGRMFLDFVHPEDVESTVAAVSRLVNQEQVLNFVNRFCCKDGEYRWIEWRSRPMGQNIYAVARDITERKQADVQLQQSEENLARTLQSIGDGVISTDREGRVVRMNPVAETLCGWKESEAKGRHLDEVFHIVHAITREVVLDPVKGVLETGQVVGLANHTLLLSRNGQEYQIADSAAPIHDRDGNITGSVLVFRDVTEEYAKDRIIREEREQLLSIFNSIDAMIYIADPDTYEVLYVNNLLAGLLPGDCIGSKCYRTFQGLEAPCGFCTNDIILGNNFEPYRWEYYNPSLDRHFSIVDRIIKWSDGRDVRFEMAIDITDRKRIEEALLESEEMQRKLLQTVPDLIIRTDLEGNITFVNELAFPGLDNLPRESICGMNIFSFIAPPDLPRAVENARQRLEKSIGPQEYQLRFDEAVIDAEVNGAVIRDKESKPVAMVYVIRDITERKRAGQEQEKLQSQLLQAQKMESIGVLAGGVAHDFNNLLQAMSGHIELLLQRRPADHPDASRLNSVVKSINRSTGLVKQLLLFGRKAESKKVVVDMNEEVKSAVQILERTIPRMISLELDLDQAPWPLFADPAQVEQVLLNLATNAVDAMPEGGKLTIVTQNIILDEGFVRMHPGSSAGRHLLLTVTDTGCGMDKENLEQIFVPFFTTKEAGKGTGLGLPSVYGIVKAHGGYIHCYSEPGLGTTFRVYFAAMEQSDVAQEEPQSKISPQGGSETILVVDDEQDIRELTQEALEMLGYTVRTAVNGEQALETYQEHGKSIDLVVLDLNMPGMGGYKCLQELLQLDSSVRVVIASGYTVNGPGKNAVDLGARGFIGKPYQLKELAAMVREVLDEKR